VLPPRGPRPPPTPKATGVWCRGRQCRGLDQLAVGGIDEIGVLPHYFKETKASQIESSRPYDPSGIQFFFGGRVFHTRSPFTATTAIVGSACLARRLPTAAEVYGVFYYHLGVFYYHLLRRKPTARLQWAFNNH
jgi:hypothetical protein